VKTQRAGVIQHRRREDMTYGVDTAIENRHRNETVFLRRSEKKTRKKQTGVLLVVASYRLQWMRMIIVFRRLYGRPHRTFVRRTPVNIIA